MPKEVEEQIDKIRFVHPIAALFANVRFLEVDYNLIARAPRGSWFVKARCADLKDREPVL